MRKLVSVQKIKSLYPIVGADLIEVAEVLGWEVVVKKGQFKEGDLCVYGEIDSIFPAENPEFEFLEGKRIKTKKLRGQVSQGIVFPMTILPEGNYIEADDLTELLKVEKYEVDPEEIAAKRAENQMDFPDWISKTDEERIQTRMELLEPESKELFGRCYATEKLDGTSATYYLNLLQENHRFGVCSRGREIPNEDDSFYWKIAVQYGMEDILSEIAERHHANQVILQGEIIGKSIQSNKYKLEGIDFYAFNLILDGKKKTTIEISQILMDYKLKTVPVVIEDFELPDHVKDLVELSKGNSVVCPKTKREGIVIRNFDSRLSFKVINPEFLLKYDA